MGAQIAVTLINDATDAVLATIELPTEQLPESFDLETKLHLGDSDWFVVEAQPRSRPEYSKLRTLTPRLRQVEKVDPRTILFSLPSLCDRLPSVGDAALSGDECVLAEDDWRQLELVSRQFGNDIDAETAAIRRIHAQERAEAGWRNVHVRSRPDPPIAGALTLDDVASAFGGDAAIRGVRFRETRGPVLSAYSIKARDGLTCYGLVDGGRVMVLGIIQDAIEPPPAQSADVLVKIAREFDLDLVHWCRCVRASWDNPLFRHLLLGQDV